MNTAQAFASFLLTPVLLAQAPPAPPPPPPPPVPQVSGDVRTETRVEPLKSGSKLWVKNRNGSIHVSGWDKEEVALTAQLRDTERRRIELVIQRKGEDLDIEAVFQQPGWSFSFGLVPSPKCEMTLNVPHKVLGFFHTTNGSVDAANVEGYARCETTNGDIQLKGITGEARAETTNGSIKAFNLRARIKGSTTNGRIELENVEGGIELSTTNGGVSAKNLDGWGEGISLESTNGGIHVELGKATGEIHAENSNGGLDIKVPGAQVVELSKHSAHLKLPGKAQKITLDTTNGGITIRP
jgi:DUF4097 and DUF4098 domain-containing protein YvlB